jgi:NCS1 family nucleobase:cation symporter-1
MPTTTYEMVGFIIFWLVSVPFLFIRPERFKKPFFISSVGCGIAILAMMIWALSTAKGVGPIFYQGENVPAKTRWSVSWLMMAGLNQAIGQKAAGMTNESDFSRYANGKIGFVFGVVSVQWIVGILVSLGGLVTTAACQLIYGKIYWNPPDLLMVIMDSPYSCHPSGRNVADSFPDGQGSSGARAGVFFLALAFTFAILFQNVCGNAVAGGIDLAGIFPRYIDIQRGAIITFVAAWIIQPWQLINRAATFITVLSSFSVFLAPLMGVMIADYFFVRHQKIRLSHLYRSENSDYWFNNGFNLRVIPCWIAGWAPTIGGLIVSAGGMTNAPRALFQLYYTAFFTGMAISFTSFYTVNLLFPIAGRGEFDTYDDWATFTLEEAAKLGITPSENAEEFANNRFGRSGYRGDKSPGQKEMEAEADAVYFSSAGKADSAARSGPHHS